MSTFLLICSYFTSAQKMQEVDSLRILNLKFQLVNAKDKTKVDVLNKLAGEYQLLIGTNDPLRRGDSLYKYASLANSEAKALNYKYGVAFSLLRLSRYFIFYAKDEPTGKDFAQKALKIGEEINNAEILGWYYYYQWDLKKAYNYFRAANNKEAEADAAVWLCYEYSRSGKYDEEGFKYCQRAIELANIKKVNTPSWGAYISQFSFEILSDMNKEVGDYDAALNYLRQARKYAAIADNDMSWAFGRLFLHIGKYDSSVFYFEKALTKDPENRFLVKHVGTANLYAKRYERAAQFLEKALLILQKPELANKPSPINWRGEIHLELAEALAGLNKNNLANENYRTALDYQRIEYNNLMNSFNKKEFPYAKLYDLVRISEGLSKSFYALGYHDSAYIYLIKHNGLKDSVQNRNVLWRLNMQLSNFKRVAEEQKRTSQINLLNKDNQLKEQKLKQQAFVKNSLLIGIVLLFFLGVLIFRTLLLKRKNEKLASEKTKAGLQQKVIELEMQALRTQMNPHFIFNCLSSINKFILKSDTDAASDYLTRFSRLIRLVLTNSQLSLIPLSDEIEMLRLYLDMERLRFSEAFDYNIIYENTIEPEIMYIPPMLLQPFCENAIWHGLMHKEGKGKLDVMMSIQDGVLQCIIADNGIGREKAAELKTKSGAKQKSFGLKITTERLALFNNEKTVNSFYNTENVLDDNGDVSGTKVTLKITYKDSVGETALRSLRNSL